MAVLPSPDESSQPETFRLLENKVDTLERSVEDLVAMSRLSRKLCGVEEGVPLLLGDWELLKAALAHLMCHRASDFPETLFNLSILHGKKRTLLTAAVRPKVMQQSAMELGPNVLPPCRLLLSLVLRSGSRGNWEGGQLLSGGGGMCVYSQQSAQGLARSRTSRDRG